MTQGNTVWGLYHINFHGDEDRLIDLFSSKEWAEKCKRGYTFWDQSSLHIVELTVRDK